MNKSWNEEEEGIRRERERGIKAVTGTMNNTQVVIDLNINHTIIWNI